MSVINYDQNLVEWNYYPSHWTGEPGTASPGIEFFIHVWQRANTIKDIEDTFRHAFEKSKMYRENDVVDVKSHWYNWRFYHDRSTGWGKEFGKTSVHSRYVLPDSYGVHSARASRWRKKGVPLQNMKKREGITARLARLAKMESC
jgi:hypothetical protein